MILVIQTFITVWNDFMTGYLYLPSHPTLALGLQQMQAQFVDYGNDYPVMFAGIILAMIPDLVCLHIGLEALEVQFVCSDGVVAQPAFQLQVGMVLAVNHR